MPRERGRDRALRTRSTFSRVETPEPRPRRRARAEPLRRPVPHRPRGARGRARPPLGAPTRASRATSGAAWSRRSARASPTWRPAIASSAKGFCYCGACRRCRAGETHLCEQVRPARVHARGRLRRARGRAAPRRPPRCRDTVPLDSAVLIEPASVVLEGLERARPRAGRDDRRRRRRHARRAGDRARPLCSRRRRSSPTACARPSSSWRGGSARPRRSTSPAVGGRTRASSISSSRRAGAVAAVELATRLPREGGRIVALGIAGEGSELYVPADRFVLRDLELLGSVGYTTAGLEPRRRAARRRPRRPRAGGRTARPGRAVRGCLRADGGRRRRRRADPPGARGGVTDRADFLRRAGTGAAGLSLAQLLGPAAALAGDGGGDFPAHPRWRFVFVSHETLDPLLVATQFGAQDAAALVKCSMQWTGLTAREREGDGEGASARRSRARPTGSPSRSSTTTPSRAEARGRPRRPASRWSRSTSTRARVPAVRVRRREPARRGHQRRRARSRGSRRAASVILFAPQKAKAWTERRLQGLFAGLAGRVEGAGGDRGPALRRRAQAAEARSRRPTRAEGHPRAASRSTASGTLACGGRSRASACARRAVQGGGYDLLPDDLSLVADGTLDFVVDQQPYVQGFAPVMQLFLARISQGTVIPVGHRDVGAPPPRRRARRSSRRRAASRAARAGRRTRSAAADVRRRWLVLAVGTVAQTSQAAVLFGLAVLAPALRDRYGLSLSQVGVMLGVVGVGAVLTLLPWGLAADRVGERVTATVGLLGAAAALAAAAFAPEFASLVLSARRPGAFGASIEHGDRPGGDELVQRGRRAASRSGSARPSVPIGGFCRGTRRSR